MQETAVFRILDANTNRATEGLRVVEEYVRFSLDDSHLTGLAKQLRHDVTETVGSVPLAKRLAARETQYDVGTRLSTDSEIRRESMNDLLAANFQRVEQSLRCLEEYSKMVEPEIAARFETLRYRAYTLHRAIDSTQQGCQRLAGARLYVLIDGRDSKQQLADLAGPLIAAGVDVFQLRDKHLSDRELLARARLLRQLTRGTETLLVVNDRPDLAVLADADGVHVGQEELSVKDARAIVGTDRLVGVSTHSLDQARQAVLDGANYIGCGPTFPSSTKTFDRFPGLDLLRAVAQQIRLPAFAIGGITPDNVGQVLEAGFGRVAVGAAVTSAADPAAAARSLRQEVARRYPSSTA
jgi:thiamine-phosphate pyrophosphorylase